MIELHDRVVDLYLQLESSIDDDGLAHPTMASLENEGYGRREIVRCILQLVKSGAIEPYEDKGYKVHGIEYLIGYAFGDC